MDKRVFIVHGWEGYPEEGWRPWLAKELEKKGWFVDVPAMPDTNSPKMHAWINHLAKVVGEPLKNDYFVGHSLGCITILRYLEKLKISETVGGAILVAGFGHDLNYTGYRNELESFFLKPVLWNRIKKICPTFVAVFSDDDQYVPLENGNLFRKKLEAEIVVVSGMKHFSGDDGITQLPLVRDILLKMAQ